MVPDVRAGADRPRPVLTRNGHGAGFWDRLHQSQLGDRLTAMCKPMGESHVYVGDDGQVWFS